MHRQSRRHRGYTFTEILIVTAIVGVLVALLLPAVQAAREAARRMSCGNNLEQLILAVHNYEMLHQSYPPGTINQTGPIQSLPQGYHHNWIIQLLPYLEQKNASAHIDRLVGVYHPNNMPVRRLDISSFSCPSSPRRRLGYSDYAGVHNDVEAPIDVTNNGVFFLNSRVDYFDLKDGSSNTLFIGEKETYAGDLGWMSGTRATLRNTGILINAASIRGWRAPRYSPRPSGYPAGLEYDGLRGEPIPSDEVILDVLFGEQAEQRSKLSAWPSPDDRLTVDEVEYSDETGMYGSGGPDPVESRAALESLKAEEAARDLALKTFTDNPALAVGGFGSPHPGGAQFALGDGSVRFYAQTTDAVTLLQLGHRDDGRLNSED